MISENYIYNLLSKRGYGSEWTGKGVVGEDISRQEWRLCLTDEDTKAYFVGLAYQKAIELVEDGVFINDEDLIRLFQYEILIDSDPKKLRGIYSSRDNDFISSAFWKADLEENEDIIKKYYIED